MSNAIQRRRGTTAEHAGFTGLAGELTVDTTKNTVVVHNGSTAGGFPLAKEADLLALQDAYGIAYNQSTDTVTPQGALLMHQTLPIQNKMRRCVLTDAGAVNYYLHPMDSRFKADGSASVLTGTDGQVMVEIPKFYVYTYSLNDTHYWMISDKAKAGYTVHPAFVKNGVEVDNRYYSSYEGSVSGGKLQSVSGQYPVTNQTRSYFRGVAAARGTGWRQLDFWLHQAVLMLAAVEYKSWDFRAADKMTAGRTGLSGGGWTNGSYISLTGLSNTLGNRTGGVSNGGTSYSTDFMSYRGIENFFGHIWKFIDGLTVDATANNTTSPIPLWVTNNQANFADTGNTGMTLLGNMPNIGSTNEGYVSALMPNLTAGAMIGAAVGASSTTKLRSYLWQYSSNSNGWRAPCVGAGAANGALAAPLPLDVAYPSSIVFVNFGARAGF